MQSINRLPHWLSHDQLAFAIVQRYPHLKPGRDFITGHPVQAGSDVQLGDAQILLWPDSLDCLSRDGVKSSGSMCRHGKRYKFASSGMID